MFYEPTYSFADPRELLSTMVSTAALRESNEAVRDASTHAKLKTTKKYFDGLSAIHAKICTAENYPLYGTSPDMV